MAMHHFYRCSPESIGHLMEEFRQALSDPDPGVMEAAVVLLHDVIKVGSELSYIFLIASFLSLFLSLSFHFPFCLSLSLSLSLRLILVGIKIFVLLSRVYCHRLLLGGSHQRLNITRFRPPGCRYAY